MSDSQVVEALVRSNELLITLFLNGTEGVLVKDFRVVLEKNMKIMTEIQAAKVEKEGEVCPGLEKQIEFIKNCQAVS